MPIPGYQSIMLPLLYLSRDGKPHAIHDAEAELALQFNVSEEERARLLPSGQNAVFSNKVWWARTHLKKAGLVEYPKKAHFQITTRGKQVLSENPTNIGHKIFKAISRICRISKSKSSRHG